MLAIWHDVAEGSEAAVTDWYNHEHHAERLAVPGFLEARRGRLAGGTGQQFCSLYRTTGPEVLTSPPYLARLGAPSPRTREIMPLYRNMTRTICRVALEGGAASGGALACFAGSERLDEVPLDTGKFLSALTERPGVLRCTVLLPAGAAPSTREAALRGGADGSVGWAVLVDTNEAAEAVSLLPVLENALGKLPGGARPLHRAAYRVVYAGRAVI
jgi:hypothetical protein